ncbi:MAG: hypothetical protein JRM85_04585 [Nitrososphaerota archaeon]|jgi:hypothetical protein|nr:hypothetical protein [Nitrososphaerota archaeon]MDG6916855.1 hypothetical protein [Nitrososphaerota archaeon]
MTEAKAPAARGEVHFACILSGMAIRDVRMAEDPKSKEKRAGGTTLRFYDPEKDNWQSTWVSPRQTTTLTCTGGGIGNEIVLEAVNKQGRLDHRVFYDIKKGSSFMWRGESSSDGGKTWKAYARYRCQGASGSAYKWLLVTVEALALLVIAGIKSSVIGLHDYSFR